MPGNDPPQSGSTRPGSDQPAPQPRQQRQVWESKNYVIPLDLSADVGAAAELRRRYDEIVREHLDRLAQEGWQPDGPTDLKSLQATGRLKTGMKLSGFLGMGDRVRIYRSATIRIKRLVSQSR